MEVKTGNWFECKVRYEKTQEDGIPKKVTETYVVDGINFGDERLQKFRISVGEELICDIDFKAVKGRNGGTFNSVDCWNVTRVNQVQQQAQPQAPMQQPQQAAAAPQGCQVIYPDRQPAQAPRQTQYQPQQTQTPFPPPGTPQDDGQLPF